MMAQATHQRRIPAKGSKRHAHRCCRSASRARPPSAILASKSAPPLASLANLMLHWRATSSPSPPPHKTAATSPAYRAGPALDGAGPLRHPGRRSGHTGVRGDRPDVHAATGDRRATWASRIRRPRGHPLGGGDGAPAGDAGGHRDPNSAAPEAGTRLSSANAILGYRRADLRGCGGDCFRAAVGPHAE